MKTLTTLLIAVTASFSLNANSDVLYNDPGIDDVFPIKTITLIEQKETTVKNSAEEVWSVEYEQWVNASDFYTRKNNIFSAIEQRLESNPPAAGKARESNSVFYWDDMAGEYQLN